jgi:hypothetical protein
MIGCDGCDWFTCVSNESPNRGEDRLVLQDQAVGGLAGNVFCGDDCFDPGNRPRSSDVDRHDACIRVRTAQRGTPEHVVGPHVTRKGESTLDFRHTIGARCVRAQRSRSSCLI